MTERHSRHRQGRIHDTAESRNPGAWKCENFSNSTVPLLKTLKPSSPSPPPSTYTLLVSSSIHHTLLLVLLLPFRPRATAAAATTQLRRRQNNCSRSGSSCVGAAELRCQQLRQQSSNSRAATKAETANGSQVSNFRPYFIPHLDISRAVSTARTPVFQGPPSSQIEQQLTPNVEGSSSSYHSLLLLHHRRYHHHHRHHTTAATAGGSNNGGGSNGSRSNSTTTDRQESSNKRRPAAAEWWRRCPPR